ncbi:MAG: hypothetical protein AAGJ97_09010 [Planctomycetota bacterium]
MWGFGSPGGGLGGFGLGGLGFGSGSSRYSGLVVDEDGDALRDIDALPIDPQSKQDMQDQFDAKKAELEQQNGTEPSDASVFSALGWDYEIVGRDEFAKESGGKSFDESFSAALGLLADPPGPQKAFLQGRGRGADPSRGEAEAFAEGFIEDGSVTR